MTTAECSRGDQCAAPCGCDRRATHRGLCHTHWQQVHIYQFPEPRPIRRKPAGCSVPGCDKPHAAKGYCSTHYMAQYLRERRTRGRHAA